MNERKRNQYIITGFLIVMVGFTAVMTFGVGPRMMALRDEVDDARILYKCQKLLDGNTLELQLRSSERPNPNPMVPVKLAGLTSPPPRNADHPELIAWAEAHHISPERAAVIGGSAHKTLLAFIRKQNLWVERADGVPLSEGLPENAPVHVQVSGTQVGLKQIESGLALHRPDSPQQYADHYAKAQTEAKSAGRGLWAED